MVLCSRLGGFPVSAEALDQEELHKARQRIQVTRMLTDIRNLSGPDFDGRQAGTLGGHRSAVFLGKRFDALGMEPAGSLKLPSSPRPWFQGKNIRIPRIPRRPVVSFSFPSTFSNQEVRTPIKPNLGQDYLPILDSPTVKIRAPLVFVGYGISAPKEGYDEYDGVEVKDRVVLILRGKPSGYPHWVGHRQKEQTAREKGALGIIVMTGPMRSRYEARRGIGEAPLAFYHNIEGSQPLPGLWISTSIASRLFASQGWSLNELQHTLNETLVPQSRGLNVLASLNWETKIDSGEMLNVLALIPGQAPELKDKVVVVGAHRDHFGQQADLLFPGADDNASGTAVILEVARQLSRMKAKLKRTVLVVSFSGEERDLLGSRHYVANPVYPMADTVGMVNVDHVGVGNGRLTVGIANFPRDISQQAADISGVSSETDLYGFFPGGDHVPFAEAKVPTFTVVSGGHHSSFHQPSDTADKIQAKVLEKAARYVMTLVWLLANQ